MDLMIPNRNKLYGREQDILTLLDSFERISSGQGEVMLVHGHSGAGKTALVNELQTPIRARNGFFIQGKFNQYQQNIPYFAFKQALAELCRELQDGDSQQRSRLKSEILLAIGNHGQLLVDLVPEFASLLGTQPALSLVSPQEARHRFAEMFRNFLKALCRPEHPMVLFIDDWQWADAASFDLLKQIQVGSTQRYLLAIVSYRDDEVASGHPLLSAVADLRMHSVPVVALAVNNITADDVREMVIDMLHPAAEDVDALARIIHGKTLGNPFFVRSFLLFLHESNIIWFDSDRSCWRWRMAAGADDLPGNVVELFSLKLRRLDAESRELCSLAACLGHRFDIDTLGIISGLTPKTCLSLLLAPKVKDIFSMLPDSVGSSGSSCATQRCSFLHDRLQQAAYMLIEPEELPQIHLKIGRLLLNSLHPEQLTERLFEVVHDLNAGFHLLQDIAERLKVAELNLAAARKAYDATAYSSALLYYRAAARFSEDPEFSEYLWCNCHQMAMAILKELAVCEFLAGDRHQAERCIRYSVDRSESALEQADALCILIVQYTLLARYPEAIAAGRQALESLQITLPECDYQSASHDEIAQVREVLGRRPIASLAELPVMSDPNMLMAAKILITMGPPCYRSHQQLWSVIVPKVVNLTLRWGNIPQIGYSHTAFGGLLGWVADDYATAKEFGALASRLMTDTFTNPADQSVFYLMIGSSIRHWSKHLKYGSQDYRDAYQIGLRSGNLQYAAYAFGHNMYCRFYQGATLAGLILESQHSLDFSRVRLNQWAVDLLEGGLRLFSQLSGDVSLQGGSNFWSEEEYLGRVEEHNNIQVACIYKVMKACHLLVIGVHQEALATSDQAQALIYTVGTQGLLPWPEHVFARFLILTALYAKADLAQQSSWRRELEPMINRLRIWADSCPDNFRHKYLLAAAELARIEGRSQEAMPLYDAAIESAHSGNFVQWLAVANERASGFWRELGNERLSHSYWQQAYVGYLCWGAFAKVYLMEADYRIMLAQNLPSHEDSRGGSQTLPVSHALVEKQLLQLRDYAWQMQQSAVRGEAVTQAKELVRATQQLRIEVAERKCTEEALRQSEDRFRKLFVQAPMGIALVDSLSGEICEVNPMFARIAGRSMEEMVQTDWLKITHPDDVQKDLDQMALMNAGEISGFQMEKRYLLPGGNPVWISMTIAPVEVREISQPRHLCIIEDITARKQAEKDKQLFDLQLLQTQKLESLGVLAGGIAHDFNNILMAIIGNAGLALMTLPPESPIAENLHAIEVASSRAADLAKQMLAYSGKGRFVVQAIDLNRLLEEMLHILKVSISKKAVLCFNRSASVPTVEADATQMRQVIMNLVINASEAIGDRSGVIAVNTGCIECDREYLKNFWLDELIPEGTYVYLEISDTGCGMDNETMTKLFDPFFTTKFTGRGLGMAAVLGIMRGHKGAIRVYSEPGRGTTFKLLIPASRKSAEQIVPDSGIDDWRGSGKVLFVDDEETVQATGGMMLRALGFTPIIANDGREALEIFQKEPDIAFVILDLTMPRMDGEQCFKELRKLRGDTKVIMSSGYNEQEVTQRFLGKGLTSFIQKPYKLTDLKEAIMGL